VKGIAGRILLGIRAFLVLTLQEMALFIYIGIRLDTLTQGEIALIALYCVSIVVLGVDLYVNKFPFYRSK
jgi:hypothetical protein